MKSARIVLIVGNRGSGKSALAKHIILRLSQKPLRVPCVVFDSNREYRTVTRQPPILWGIGGNFRFDLNETGPAALANVVKNCFPFTDENSPTAGVFENTISQAFQAAGFVDLPSLMVYQYSQQAFIQAAIIQRLQKIHDAQLFVELGEKPCPSFRTLYECAADGEPAVFDLSELTRGYRSALVSSVIKGLERICHEEASTGRGRYCSIFWDECHEYISKGMVAGLISRGRHIGASNFFITCRPSALSDEIWTAADNIAIGRLNHDLDIKSVAKVAYADSESLAKFAQTLQPRRMLLLGQLTSSYCLHVRTDSLPSEIAQTGTTRSTFDRLRRAE